MFKKSLTKKNSGFTLIELLVVVFIIGTLATIVLNSLNIARMKARDVRRISDLRQVALALELYYDDHTSTGYPGTNGVESWAELKSALEGGSNSYMSVAPIDPGANHYEYWVNSGHQRYVLKATLEDLKNAALVGDLDGIVFGCDCDEPAYCIQL